MPPLLLPPRVTASQPRGMELQGMLQPLLLPPPAAAARALMGSRVDMEPRLHTRDMGSSRPLEHHPGVSLSPQISLLNICLTVSSSSFIILTSVLVCAIWQVL